MKKIYLLILALCFFLTTPVLAKTNSPAASKAPVGWKPATPEGYTQITWAKAPGVVTYYKAPIGNGSLDFITRIYLPQNEINFITSSSTPLEWGVNTANFIPDGENNFHNLAFEKLAAETFKKSSATAKFVWNAPFFNVNNSVSDLSFALKTTVGTTTLVSSGSRPDADMAHDRRMLIINNQKATAHIKDFDALEFVDNNGDQGIEGFAPSVAKNDSDSAYTARLFIGVSENSKELVIYCSQQARVQDASNELLLAGVPVEKQLEADGGGSAACGYNLPGQFFVEPSRMLPLLMGASTLVARGTGTNNGLNIRSGPSTKYSIVGKLNKGEAVRVYEEKNGWFRIGDKQWVLKTLIKKTS